MKRSWSSWGHSLKGYTPPTYNTPIDVRTKEASQSEATRTLPRGGENLTTYWQSLRSPLQETEDLAELVVSSNQRTSVLVLSESFNAVGWAKNNCGCCLTALLLSLLSSGTLSLSHWALTIMSVHHLDNTTHTGGRRIELLKYLTVAKDRKTSQDVRTNTTIYKVLEENLIWELRQSIQPTQCWRGIKSRLKPHRTSEETWRRQVRHFPSNLTEHEGLQGRFAQEQGCIIAAIGQQITHYFKKGFHNWNNDLQSTNRLFSFLIC